MALAYLSLSEFKPGYSIDVAPMSLSEQQIIEFAKRFDPLDFHTKPELAKKSFFKGHVASGPHFFNAVYQQHYLPIYRDTIVCGLEINKWKFKKPIYADAAIRTNIKVADIQANHDKGTAAVTWHFDFCDDKNDSVQSLEMIVLHKIR